MSEIHDPLSINPPPPEMERAASAPIVESPLPIDSYSASLHGAEAMPKPPLVPDKSVFKEIGNSLADMTLNRQGLDKIQTRLESAHKSRGFFAPILDWFGAGEGKTLSSLRSHILERKVALDETDSRQKAENDKRTTVEATKLAADLQTQYTDAPTQLSQELVTKATLANAEGNTNEFSLALRTLALLAKSPEKPVADAAVSALAEVQKLPVLERSTAQRTPSELLINFASELKSTDTHGFNADQRAAISQVEAQAKAAFTSHDLSVTQTRKLFLEFGTQLTQAGLTELASKNADLLKQLPTNAKDISQTRYHDNIYGRVFDSRLMANLVNNPPDGVKDAMTKSSALLADWMSDPSKIPPQDLEKAGKKAQEYLKTIDPRFWFKQAAGLESVRDAKTPQEATSALISFLRSPKSTGVESIAVPYLTVKLSIILRDIAVVSAKEEAAKRGLAAGSSTYNDYTKSHTYDYTPWMQKADENYNIVGLQASRHAGMKPATPLAAAGITLQHQPAAVHEDWMTPALRPTTLNRPKLGEETSEATRLALEQGIPFASGVSGSTNINLHFLDYMKKNVPGAASIDPKNFLLGNTMFLVYDGGHSIHEALWVANQTDQKTGLGLALGKSSDPNSFIANMQNYINANDGLTKERLQSATDQAWQDTTDYFRKHSAYRRTPALS